MIQYRSSVRMPFSRHIHRYSFLLGALLCALVFFAFRLYSVTPALEHIDVARSGNSNTRASSSSSSSSNNPHTDGSIFPPSSSPFAALKTLLATESASRAGGGAGAEAGLSSSSLQRLWQELERLERAAQSSIAQLAPQQQVPLPKMKHLEFSAEHMQHVHKHGSHRREEEDGAAAETTKQAVPSIAAATTPVTPTLSAATSSSPSASTSSPSPSSPLSCPSYLPAYPRTTVPPCLPVSLQQYPIPSVHPDPNHCSSEDNGLGLLKRWGKDVRRVVCNPLTDSSSGSSSDSGSGSGSRTTISMHRLRQKRHLGDDFFVSFENIEWSPFSSLSPSSPIYGRFLAACTPVSGFNSYNEIPTFPQMRQVFDHIAYAAADGKARKIIESDTSATTASTATQTASVAAPTSAAASSSSLFASSPPFTLTAPNPSFSEAWKGVTTFFVWRDCRAPFNPFHCLGDVVNLMLMQHMFAVEPKDTRVIFLDPDQDESTFANVWHALAGRGAYTVDALRKQQFPFVSPADGVTAATPLFLPRAFLQLNTGANLIWKDGGITDPCGTVAPILKAFNRLGSDVILGLHGRPVPTELRQWYAKEASRSEAERKRIRIVVSSRRKAKYRRASNEDALVRRLEEEFVHAPIATSQQQQHPGYEVVQVDLVELSFPEQAALITSARVIIGMHGAGLCLIVFHAQPESAFLIEMFRGDNDRPRVYENMALRIGMKYDAWVNHDPSRNTQLETNVDIEQIIKMTRNALKQIEQS